MIRCCRFLSYPVHPILRLHCRVEGGTGNSAALLCPMPPLTRRYCPGNGQILFRDLPNEDRAVNACSAGQVDSLNSCTTAASINRSSQPKVLMLACRTNTVRYRHPNPTKESDSCRFYFPTPGGIVTSNQRRHRRMIEPGGET